MKTQIQGFGLRDVLYNTSLAGWVLLSRPLIYILFSRRRDLQDYGAVDFSALIFILYSVVAFIIGWRVIARSESSFGKFILGKSPILIFMIYSMWAIVSMFWSVSYQLTGFRAFECIAMTLLIVAVIQELFETESLKFVCLWSLLYCSWGIILTLAQRIQIGASLGDLLESSQMGSTIFFFMALYFVPRRWYNYMIMVLALFSMSTVSYLGMGIGSISVFWNRGRVRFWAYLGAFALMLIVIAVGPYQLIKDTIFFDKNEISMEETSGRNQLMEASLESLTEHPMGLGFFAAEPYILYNKGFRGAINAHNSLFSAGLGMGIPGMVIMAIFFFAMGFISFSRYIPKRYRAILIGCFIVAFVHCMGNPSVGSRVYGAWMSSMYIFVLISGMFVYGKFLREYNEKELEEDEAQ